MTRVRETARTRRLRRGACPEPFDLPTVRPDRSASLRAGFVEGLGSGPSPFLADLRRRRKNSLHAISSGSVWCSYVALEAVRFRLRSPADFQRTCYPVIKVC